MDIDWIKEAGAKTLEEFREQQELARDAELDGWQLVPIYCPECEMTFDEPLDMRRLERIAKKLGRARLNYQTHCVQCSLDITQEVGLPKWEKYALRGPQSWWGTWGQVAAGALVAAGFGVYWHTRRQNRINLEDDFVETLSDEFRDG